MQRFLSSLLAVILVFSVSMPAFAATETWMCSNGHENPEDNLFCGKCGEAKPEEPKPWICSNGHENIPENVFCTKCGEMREIPGEQLWKEPFENEEYANALPMVQKAANQGDVEAIAALAQYEIYGYVGDKDYKKGLELAQQAADAGNANGMYLVAYCCENGKGTSKDYDKAIEWYTKAADLGNDNAMSNLGDMYRYGKGTSSDNDMALFWIMKAAELGNDDAMYKLGYMYLNGVGVSANKNKAREWFKKAADKGNKSAEGALKRLDDKKSGTKAGTGGTKADTGVSVSDLLGYWTSSNGMYTFEMKENGAFTTTIPVVPQSGDSGLWDNGVFFRYYSNSPGIKTPNLKFILVSDTDVEIYSYQTKTTYTLHKRR